MKKKLSVLFSVLVVLFQFSNVHAQERVWWLSRGSIHSARTDGTDHRLISNPGGGGIYTEITGFSRAANGITYVKFDPENNEGDIGVLNGSGAVDIYDLCYACPFGSEGITSGFNARTYIPFRGTPKIHGVRIVDNETHAVETVSFSSTALLADDFYLTGTADGVFGLSKGYTGNYGMIYRLSENGKDILPIYHFTGGNNGARPTGKLVEGTDGSLFGETYQGGKDNKGIYFKVNKDGSNFVKLGDIADGKRTDLVNGKYQVLLNHIAAGYKPIRDSQGFIYHGTPFGVFKINDQGETVLKLSEEAGFLVDLFDAAGTSAVKVSNIPSGATDVPVNAIIQLDTVPGSKSYELQLSTSPDFKTDVKSYNILYLPQTNVKLAGGTTYYARARAWDWPYYGEVVQFTTETVIDFSQERLWGYYDDGDVPLGSNIFSMKKDGTDLIIHQQTAGGFIRLSDHHVLTTTLNDDGDFMNRIDRTGMTYLHAMDYQQGYTVGTSMIEVSPGRLVGTQFGAGTKVRGLIEFDVEGTLYEHRTFSTSKDLSRDQYLTKTSHGIYGVSRGDSNNKGFIYRVNDDMRAYTIVYQFQGLDDGKQPVGRIYAGTDDFIFGQTQRGGINNKGIYFKVKDDGTSFTKIGDVHNGEPWIEGAGGKYSNLEHLVNAGYPGVTQDSDGNYYLGTSNGILKIGPDFYLKKLITGVPNAENLTIVAPSFQPETFVSNISDGASGLPNNLTLRTDSFPGATQYFFELSTTPDFGTIDFAVSNSKPFAAIGLASNQTYYARVRPNVWPYFGRVISFNTYDEFTLDHEQLVIRTVPPAVSGVYVDGILYTDKNGNNSVTLASGPFNSWAEEGRSVLPLFNGEILYKHDDQLLKITKDGIVKLYEGLDWSDYRLMQASWIQGPGGDVYAIRRHINTPEMVGIVRVKMDGSGIEFHPMHHPQFNASLLTLTSTPFGIYGINQGTGGSPGVIFRVNDDLSGIEIIHTFSGTSKPQGELLYHDGLFWGVTRNGGNFGGGVIYRITPEGTNYEVLHHFAPGTGKSPVVGLLNGINGWLYGVTREGGKDNKGVLFRINEYFFTYEVIRHFADVGGQNPEHPLIMDNDWHIYGAVKGLGYFKTNLDNTFFTTILHASDVSYVYPLQQRFVPNVEVMSPADQTEISADDSGFMITDVPGATTYFVEVSESPTFKGQVDVFSGTAGNPVQVTGLRAHTTYYARVRTNLLPFYGKTTSFTTGAGVTPLSDEVVPDARAASPTVVYAYPNPTAHAFTFTNDLKVKSIVVTDASGAVVYENKNLNDASLEFGKDFRKGIYILKIVTDDGVKTSRLVKN